jgi:hypothetical protein
LEFNDDGMMCLDVAKKTFLVNSTAVGQLLPVVVIRTSLMGLMGS